MIIQKPTSVVFDSIACSTLPSSSIVETIFPQILAFCHHSLLGELF